jgi:cupin fold WbuC family metalloprotein
MSDSVILFDASMIPALKAQAIAAPLKRARINLHASHDDRCQEMIIAEHKSTYVRPHRHPGRLESFHVIDGAATIVIFDDDGKVTQTIRMGPAWFPQFKHQGDCKAACLYRQRESIWHTVLVETDFLVVHEVVDGPFPYETQFAPWAPAATDTVAGEAYMVELRKRVGL